MENPEISSPAEMEKSHVSMPELGKMFEMHNEEKTGFLNRVSFAGVPVAAIAFAELLIFGGRVKEAAIAHTLLFLALSFSIAVFKNQEKREIYQALLLLPILRLVNLSMPIFFEDNLYSLVFIYAPLAIPATIASIHQKSVYETRKTTLKKLWIYLPFSAFAGLVFGGGEYMILRNEALIPDLSLGNLLTLIFVMVFVVGLVEELVFRAILQTRLEGFLGAVWGIFLASLLFGVMHSGYGSILEIVYTFIVGAFLGCLFQRTRSLPLVILIHGSTNVFLFGILPNLG